MNSSTAHNFEKVNFLEAYNTVNKFDIICLSESFLDPSILTENNNLKINGYKMVRADHPHNVKGRGVCAYVRESLPVLNFSNSYLSECLTLEVTISNKKCYIITLYRSPSCSLYEQVILFNRTILNIFHNFIPSKIILCDDRNRPWTNEKFKHLIKKSYISKIKRVKHS